MIFHSTHHFGTFRASVAALMLLISAPWHAAWSADESMEKALQAYAAGNYQQALEIWLLSAYDGDPEGQYRLGTMFAEGTGTVADQSEAAYWFTRAAEQGHTDAQFELGKALFHGAGVPPDKSKAVEWWHVAAENGNVEAQYNLGRVYFYGIDLEQDATRAMEWFSRAADNGDELAIEFLQRVGTTNASSEPSTSDWTGYGRIGDRAVWVYASFNRLSPILQKLESGALLRVNEQRSGWFRVQVPGGLPVWVAADKVEAVDDGHRIVGVGVQARADPDNDPGVDAVGMFLDGDRVIPLQTRDDWIRVQAPESISGWVEAIDVVELGDGDDTVAAEWRTARELAQARAVAATSGRTTVVLASAGDSDGEADAQLAAPVPAEGVSSGIAIEVAPTERGSPTLPESSQDSSIRALASEVAAATSTSGGEQDESQAQVAADQAADEVLDGIRIGPLVDAASISPGDYLRVGRRSQSVYAENRLSSARIELLPPGLLVRAVEVRDDWVRVEVPGGLPLWIFSRFIEHDGNTGRITAQGVRARPLPSTSSNSQPVGIYAEGASVRVITESDQWIRIHAPEAISAWMRVQGLHSIDADAATIADLWSEQGADGVIALNGLAAADVERVVQGNGGNGDEPPALVDPRTPVHESAASTVRFGRQEAPAESTAREAEPVEVAQLDSGADGQPVDDTTTDPVEADSGTADAAQPLVEEVAEAVSEASVEEPLDAAQEQVVQAQPEAREPVAGEEVVEPGDSGTDSPASAGPEVIVVETGAVDARQETPSDPSEPALTEGGSTDSTPVEEAPREESSAQAAVTEGEASQETSTEAAPTTDAPVVEQPGSETANEDAESDAAELADSGSSPQQEIVDGAPGGESSDEQTDAVAQQAGSDPDAGAGSDDPASAEAIDISEGAASGQLAEAESPPSEATESPEVDVESPDAVTGDDTRPTDDSQPVEEPSDAEIDTFPVTSTPTPEAESVGNIRFDDLDWLYQQSPDAFSIEVLRDADREAVILAGEHIPESDVAYSFSARESGAVVYNLMVGSYPNLVEVQQSLGALQAGFDTIRIRRLGAVQRQWCDQLDNLTPEQLMLVLDRCAR